MSEWMTYDGFRRSTNTVVATPWTPMHSFYHPYGGLYMGRRAGFAGFQRLGFFLGRREMFWLGP